MMNICVVTCFSTAFWACVVYIPIKKHIMMMMGEIQQGPQGLYMMHVFIGGSGSIDIYKLYMLLPRPRRGLRGIVFTRSVCLSVCLSVCVSVCPANILVFYFSAIRRDIDLKFIQDTYMVVLNSLK